MLRMAGKNLARQSHGKNRYQDPFLWLEHTSEQDEEQGEPREGSELVDVFEVSEHKAAEWQDQSATNGGKASAFELHVQQQVHEVCHQPEMQEFIKIQRDDMICLVKKKQIEGIEYCGLHGGKKGRAAKVVRIPEGDEASSEGSGSENFKRIKEIYHVAAGGDELV